MRHKGIWGTVCKEYFSEDEAKVFCRFLLLLFYNISHDDVELCQLFKFHIKYSSRMLGYEGNATFDSTGDEVGQRKGSWPIWITLEEEGKCHST